MNRREPSRVSRTVSAHGRWGTLAALLTKGFISIVVPAAVLLAAQWTRAQGTIYASNLGPASDGSERVGGDVWMTQCFVTGTNAGGYSLKAVQVLTTAASGNPSGFAVLVYAHSSEDPRFPAASLGSLSGPDPAAGGTFTYTTAGMALSPATSYFLVLTAGTPVADGAYSWSSTCSSLVAASDGWGILGFRFSSGDGVNWSRSPGPLVQFAVSATPLPEPRSWLLLLLGLTGWNCWRQAFRRSGAGLPADLVRTPLGQVSSPCDASWGRPTGLRPPAAPRLCLRRRTGSRSATPGRVNGRARARSRGCAESSDRVPRPAPARGRPCR